MLRARSFLLLVSVGSNTVKRMQTASNNVKTAPEIPSRGRSGPSSRWRVGVRVGLVAVAVLMATRLLTAAWFSAWARVSGPGPASADELLALVTSGFAIGVAAWLVGATVLEIAAHVPGRLGRAASLWSRRLTPAVARRVACLVLGIGVGVVGGPAQSAATGPTVTVTPDASRSSGADAPDPGFRVATEGAATATATPTPAPTVTPAPTEPEPEEPARASVTEPVPPGFTPAPPRVRPQADPGLLGARVRVSAVDEVVVHRGDSLWSIAARHLGPDASAAEVDRSWREWFSLNRDRIGADPHLILPGQVLRAPGPDLSTSEVR